jgi:hypothetical protein
MQRASWVGLVAALALAALLPPLARGQLVCEGEHESFANACFLGAPDAHGVTVTSALSRPGQVRAYKFRVGPLPSAAHLYLGDLWYDLNLVLYRDPPDLAEIGRWFVARSAETGQRVLQFERPEVIVQSLDPGTYTLFVEAADGRSADPNRPYTARLALGPPICASERDAGGLYQLALTYEPSRPTAASLISFNAFVAPPYTDLFDFDWAINGQTQRDADGATLQIAASDLPGAAGEHRVRVTARGVREYPDPDPRFRHVPPTLSVECTLSTAGP